MHMTDFQKCRDIARVRPFNSRDIARVRPLAMPGQQRVADRYGTGGNLSSIRCHPTCCFDRDLRAVRARFRRAARHDHGPRRSLGTVTIGHGPHLTPEGAASLLASHVSPKCTPQNVPRQHGCEPRAPFGSMKIIDKIKSNVCRKCLRRSPFCGGSSQAKTAMRAAKRFLTLALGQESGCAVRTWCAPPPATEASNANEPSIFTGRRGGPRAGPAA